MYIQEENKNRMDDQQAQAQVEAKKTTGVEEQKPSSVSKEDMERIAREVGAIYSEHPSWMPQVNGVNNTSTSTAVPGAEDSKAAVAKSAGEVENALSGGNTDENTGEVASLVIPEGQKMNIDGKYGPADDKFMYGTIEELNAARKSQEPQQEPLTKDDIEKLNATGGRRTRRHNKKSGKKSGKKSRRQSKKGGKKHRKSAKTGSKKSKKSRRYSSRK